MKPYRYIILSDAQLEEVKCSYKHGAKHHFRERCHAILLSNEGKTIPEIALLLKKRTETIHAWFNRWDQERLAGLDIKKGRGLKPVLRASQEEVVDFVKKKSR